MRSKETGRIVYDALKYPPGFPKVANSYSLKL